MDVLIELPDLPLTDTFCWNPGDQALSGIDQCLLFCQRCSHGQLQSVLAPAILYGADYGFRTAASANARKGTAFFLDFLDAIAPNRQFRCILDLGCNDLYLLGQLKDRACCRVGIDPIWRGREAERPESDITLFGLDIEEFDPNDLPEPPDLVVCRHTLEHIAIPAEVLSKLLKYSASDALCVFEVPGFDALLQRFRFDQVFHQHVHYFTLASFVSLIDAIGCRYLDHRVNYHDWGAMGIAFTPGNAKALTPARTWHDTEILGRYRLFRDQARNAGRLIASFADQPCYGYGAAQMLPVIAYHLENDLAQLTAVLDDDPAKHGIGYRNLSVKVATPDCIENWHGLTIVVTAPDNVRSIMTKCLKLNPKHLISLFNMI